MRYLGVAVIIAASVLAGEHKDDFLPVIRSVADSAFSLVQDKSNRNVHQQEECQQELAPRQELLERQQKCVQQLLQCQTEYVQSLTKPPPP